MSARLWPVALLATGCSVSMTPEIVERFSRANVCTAQQMVVRERPDLPVHAFACDLYVPMGHQHACQAEPPADVAADPGRLAMWSERARAKVARIDRRYASPVVEISGCGVHRFYTCPWVPHITRRGSDMGYYSCWEVIDLGDKEPKLGAWPRAALPPATRRP
jgi:hypothetical protein